MPPTSNLLFLFFVLALFASCSNSPRNPAKENMKTVVKPTVLKKPPSSYSDTITINVPAAVFFNPDSAQHEKLRAIMNPDVFESTMHEGFYMMRNSRMVLKKNFPKIKIIEVKNARYLLFKKTDGEKEYIDLNTKGDPLGLFLFDGKKSPVMVDMQNIETALGFYFAK
jgi:hypothetical protein